MRRRNALTLIELLCVLTILVLLAALLFPVVVRARRQAWQATCLSNLHQLGRGLRLYLDENDERFPLIEFRWDTDAGVDREEHERAERSRRNSFPNLFGPYLKSREIFRCPADLGITTRQDASQGVRHLTTFERFGTSYRPAAELGDPAYDLIFEDIPDPTRIFWAADAAGYWHPRYERSLTGEYSQFDAARWQSNTVYLDGHTLAQGFWAEVWSPYNDFLRVLNSRRFGFDTLR